MTGVGEVELLADEDRPGGWLLLLDRVRQSYVDLDDPTYLEFPYVEVFAGLIDGLPGGPLDAVHVGGGALTLPRWLAATRPGSTSVVFEADAGLLEQVRRRLPWSADAAIDARAQDGRSGLAGLASAGADLVVLDAFAGGRVPADLTTAECVTEIRRVLRPSGLLLINTTDRPRGGYTRRLVATLSDFGEVVVQGPPGRRVGNVVVAAAAAGALPVGAVLAEDGPVGPVTALSGDGLAAFRAGAVPLTDADPLRSPEPPEDTWRMA